MTQLHPSENPFVHVGLTAKGGARECGAGRTAGSIYVECGLSLTGVPLEQYLHDPPIPVEPAQLGLSSQGVTIIEDDKGVRHIVDMVGASHYPYPSDFIEEARLMGVSRKVPKTTDLRGITSASMLILVHARASVVNAAAVSAASDMICPNARHKPGEDCAGLHWVVAEENDGPGRRRLNCGTYELTPRAPGAPTPVLQHAFFMAVPITAMTVIANHDGSVDEAAQKSAGRAGVPVSVAHN
ncbi:hypothetical protein [Deinococcus soli (ex Cha et al. 2016)]|uniref:hypothetical protein n=1 Tax=Deinococcus soli (ex Cha et al. 2016) TaxID=1309411 RepID=UPI00166B8467|nr:hypothetical protein [Deinococcus soli (ex Cha et al. 2016)]GGB70567.1 hypothetical protein GCM10008019_28440 [Deinococcus soli (ex Cha et al. 2016)]